MLAQEALATASLIASCDLRVVATNIDVEKAKPVDHGPAYDELDKEALELDAKMRGSTLFAAVANQAHASEVEMLASLLIDMHSCILT